MKKIILQILLIAAFFIGPSLSKVFSQPPPPPPGGGHGQPGNKSVPVGDGIYFLAGLGLLYGGLCIRRQLQSENPDNLEL